MPADTWNITSTTIGSAVGLESLIALAVIIVAMIGLILLITSIERYTKFFDAIAWVFTTIKYALYGAGVLAVLAGTYAAFVAALTVGTGAGVKPEWAAGAVVGYAVLAAIGWLAEKVFARFTTMHARYVESKKIETPIEIIPEAGTP